jgi:aryl-alcohol dehydrogenase-like predicted oxidoreductase
VAIADAVREFARRKDCTASQIAIAWVLAQGDDILPIPGMKTRAHLADNLAALEVRLSRDEVDQLVRSVDALAVQGERQAPAMMQLIDR